MGTYRDVLTEYLFSLIGRDNYLIAYAWKWCGMGLHYSIQERMLGLCSLILLELKDCHVLHLTT